jgi:trehalose 6-phosphate synthase/phosphatase
MNNFKKLNFKRLVIVAYRLPFKLVKNGESYQAVQNSGGLVSAILSLSEKIKLNSESDSRILWVGTGEKELGEKNINPHFDLYPVDIPDEINDKYYGGFCNDTIWPLFHYFPSNTTYNTDYYEAYVQANNLFIQRLKDIIKPGDFIWVHDYQLFLLPSLIRKSIPGINIGFFLHIPFPSSEIFRLLPNKWREAILNGLLGADLIGFHTNDYAQHFLKSVKRTLGYEIKQNYVHLEKRVVKADAFPIGIDYDKFHNACTNNEVIKEKEILKRILSGRKLIFSVDRLDYSKGLLIRLKSFERFLEKYPDWQEKVVFNMVVVPSRDNIDSYIELKKEIEATVGRINGKYSDMSWRPIIYQYRSLSFTEMIALYDISMVGLITPLRDGMNLVAKEYIACQQEYLGVLILSEMAGAAVELNEAIIITPNDVEATADAICNALEMKTEDKETKIIKMQKRLKSYDVFAWANDFFNQTQEVQKVQKKLKVNYLNSNMQLEIVNAYKSSKNRIIFLDYDGTLVPLKNNPQMATLNSRIEEILSPLLNIYSSEQGIAAKNAKQILKRLSSNPKNKIVIISGRERDFLEKQFKNMPVTLIAEHGYFIKEIESDWVTQIDLNLSWKDKILPILKDYVNWCTGSMIEQKHASLTWHYRNVDQDIANTRIHELKDNLAEILKNDAKLQIIDGNKVLEIKSIMYDKGTAASTFLKDEDFDFIMAVGDDKTDEDLFRVMPENAYTIKIGNDPSIAQYSLKEQPMLYDLLETFIDQE